MGKNTEIKLVGQPILSQLLDLVDKWSFKKLVKEKQSDYYYKSFKSWPHFVTMMFGIFSRCDSMAETCEGLRAMSGKLNHLGLEKSPAKSSAGDGLRNRSNEFFEALYYQLTSRYGSFLSDSRTLGLTIKELFIVDSTTIRLFSDILKGVGRNPKNDGKKKGGLKVHMLIDAVESVGKFMKITAAKMHDKTFLSDIEVPPFSMLVFDRAYNYYKQFKKWTDKQIYFVTRQKSNAVYAVLQTVSETKLDKKQAGVLKEEEIEVSYKEKKEVVTLLLRRVCYRDEKGRQYVFICNNLVITAEEIALIYKKRWGIELLFKKMKQNFQLHYFYGENENAIRTQVWCTLIAQLLLTVLQKKAAVKKAFSTVATLVRIHLVSMLDVYDLLKNTSRCWAKAKTKIVDRPSLFPT
jgi:Transposase DDE domain/Domain of unknown function (DUF4372)